MKKHNRLDNLFIAILGGLYFSNIVLAFINGFLNLANNRFYLLSCFVLTILSIVFFIFLVIAEAVSLSFDKTASRNTLYATICMFISTLLSYEEISSLSFLDVNIDNLIIKFMELGYMIFAYLGAFYLFCFFSKDYKIKYFNKIHLVSLLGFIVLDSIFIFLDIRYGYLVSIILEVIYLIGFSIYYLINIRHSSNNYLPGVVSYIITSIIGINLLINSIPINIFGYISISYIIIGVGYVFIYANFLIRNTNKVYDYEGDISNEKLKAVMFHSFDCYYRNKLLKFPSKKSKELLALLITLKGRSLEMDKTITYLWPDKDYDLAKLSYRNTVMKLRHYLDSIDCHILSFSRGVIFIDTRYIQCDYYDVLDKKISYQQEPLLPEYDWSLDFENSLEL